MQNNKPTIHYIADPLCGWCYGFEPVMIKIQEKFNTKFNFKVMTGGMVPKAYAQPLANMREYLLEAIPTLEERTEVTISQKYRDNILMKDGIVLDSELPSKVFVGLLPYYEGKESLLMKRIQDLLYQEGLNTNEIASYQSLEHIEKIDVNSEEIELKKQEHFETSAQFGVRGFPALILEKKGGYFMMSNGYQPYEKLGPILEEVLTDSVGIL